MKHEPFKFEIKNAVIIYDKNAKESCCKNPDKKLYKIWVAARKDDLQPILEMAFTEHERFGRELFEFCQVVPASVKIKRNLRIAEYDNTDDFYTFYISKWNEPINVDENMLFQEVNIECFIRYTDIVVKDENGHCKRTSTGDYEKIPGGAFEMHKNHKITFADAADKYSPAHDE